MVKNPFRFDLNRRINVFKITIAAVFIMVAGVVQAADSIEPTAPFAESCWNLKVGAITSGQVYMLANIAKHYPSVAGEIQPVIHQMNLSPDERSKICTGIGSAKQVPS